MPEAATLPVEPFGTQSSSKCQHFGGGGFPFFYINTDRHANLVPNPGACPGGGAQEIEKQKNKKKGHQGKF